MNYGKLLFFNEMNNIKKKQGVFLSLEMIIVIVVTIIVLGLIVSGVFLLTRMSKVMNLTQEKQSYMNVFSQFRSIYGAYPGDLRAKAVTGDIAAAAAITTSYEALTTKRHWHLYPVAFSQLHSAGMIKKDSMSPGTSYPGTYNVMDDLGVFLPVSNFDSSLYWMYYRGNRAILANDPNDERELAGGVLSSDEVRGHANGDRFAKQRNAPKFVLFGITRSVADKTLAVAGVDFDTYGVPIDIAKAISEKLDTGLPHQSGSNIIADDFNTDFYTSGTHSDFSCTTKTDWVNDDMNDITFKDKNSNAHEYDALGNGCILSFIFLE